MAGNGTTVDTAEPGSITLRQLYRSIQDQLALTIERSLALGKKSLAGRLDDVLLRQRFWEEDIRLEDGALSDLEANDAVASSIIRRHLDEIRLLLRDINGTISGSHRYDRSLSPPHSSGFARLKRGEISFKLVLFHQRFSTT